MQDEQKESEDSTNGNCHGFEWIGLAVLAYTETHVRNKGPHFLCTELVVHQSTKGNGVAKELLSSDGVVEEHDRCEHKEDILENTGHGENHGRGFANLGELVTVEELGIK